MAVTDTFSFFFTPQSQAQIEAITFDLVRDEDHEYTSNVTDYPQEDGFEVQDNVWLEPFKLRINGIISDTQLIPFGSEFGVLQSRVGEIYDRLVALWESRETFQVMTGLKIYQDMIFSSFNVKRDQETGYSINLSVELKKIRKVSAQKNIDTHSTDHKSFPNNKNQGSQQLQPVDDGDIPQQDIDDVNYDYEENLGAI